MRRLSHTCVFLLLSHCTFLQPIQIVAQNEESCWGGDFNEALCCGERWGLTGNPLCWDDEYTYLRCCGIASFPRAVQDDAQWDEIRRSRPAKDAGEFDFIVVGAGSAGSVLAARLASSVSPVGNPWSVLLLEAGPWDIPEEKVSPDSSPSDPSLWRDPLEVSWNFGSDERIWKYSSGSGLGGTAAVNSMVYTRGSVSEYEELGWKPKDVLEAFKALEASMDSPGFKPDPQFHRISKGSWAADESPGYPLTLVSATLDELPPLFRALIAAFESADVPFRVDPHGSSTIHGVGGVWRSMGCMHEHCKPTRVPRFRFAKGRPRSSPYTVLVAPLNRTKKNNLKVMPKTNVERVVFDSNRKAIGVEVSEVSDANEKLPQRRWIYKAKREIIVSAGVHSSPKILTLSGVAEQQELARLGIPLVSDSPHVGRHMHEHVGVSIVASTSVLCPEGYHREAGQTTHLGNIDEFIGQIYAFFNTTGNTPGASGPTDVEVMIIEGCLDGLLSLTFTIILLQSLTLGRMVVRSRNPSTSPHLDYKPLSHSGDIDLLMNAVRLLYTKVFAADSLAEFQVAANPPFPIVADASQLARWIRGNLYFYTHPTGTCRLQASRENGVVDPKLKVFGVEGLRIADASVFPNSPSGHSDAPSRLVGEMAARFILADWRNTDPESEPKSGGPYVQLHGYKDVWMPMRGLGTNGYEGERARSAVSKFLKLGGRLIDTALTYDNHVDIGATLASSGVLRKDIFLVSKIPPDSMGFNEAAAAIDRAISELGTHLDLVLIHWPSHYEKDKPLPQCARQPGSWKECRQATWRALEAAYRRGQVRSIGVSNFAIGHLTDILDDTRRTLPVAVNELEFHPWWPQIALRQFCHERKISIIAYGSTGGSLMGGAMLRAGPVMTVAKRVGRSPAQVLLRWALQQRISVIPASTNEIHLAENLDVASWQLDDRDMAILGSIPAEERMRVYLPDPENAP